MVMPPAIVLSPNVAVVRTMADSTCSAPSVSSRAPSAARSTRTDVQRQPGAQGEEAVAHAVVVEAQLHAGGVGDLQFGHEGRGRRQQRLLGDREHQAFRGEPATGQRRGDLVREALGGDVAGRQADRDRPWDRAGPPPRRTPAAAAIPAARPSGRAARRRPTAPAPRKLPYTGWSQAGTACSSADRPVGVDGAVEAHERRPSRIAWGDVDGAELGLGDGSAIRTQPLPACLAARRAASALRKALWPPAASSGATPTLAPIANVHSSARCGRRQRVDDPPGHLLRLGHASR